MSPSPDPRIFVDTAAYYAAASRRDSDYPRVSPVMQRLILARRRFVTTNFILAELHALALARGSAAEALELVTRIRTSPATTVVRVRVRDEARAWHILAQYDDKEFSMTDALSFAVMERLGLSVAFTLDQHFVQYGWQLVELDDPAMRG
jgi:predicted nucleic acid-binding protein